MSMLMDNATIVAGTTAVGIASGLAYSTYNKHYGSSIYGSNMNDPYVGYSDYLIHGATMGAAAGLASAGLRYSAYQKKVSGLSDHTKAMLKMLGA